MHGGYRIWERIGGLAGDSLLGGASAGEPGTRRAVAWAEVEAWPLLARALCCLTVAACAAALGYLVAVADARAALGAAQAETARLAAEATRKQALATSGAAATPAPDAAAGVEVLLAGLPSEAEVPALLEGIGKAAAAARLAIVHLEVGDERPAWLGASPAPGTETPAATSPAHHLELPIEIEVRGAYHQLGAFAAAAATLPHLVALGDFELRPVDGDPSLLALKLAASTYRRANLVREP